jgi:hypothetical protein
MRVERRGTLVVIPAQAGIPTRMSHRQMRWDPGFRRDDGLWGPS